MKFSELAKPKNVGSSEYSTLYEFVKDMLDGGATLAQTQDTLKEFVEWSKYLQRNLTEIG